MKNTFKLLLLTSALLCGAKSTVTLAEEVELDRVAVIVDSGVVLESEIQLMLKNIKNQAKKENQTLPSDRVLRIQVVEKLVNDNIILQMGERMGVQISDAQLDETLTNMAKSNGLSLEDFRQSLVDEGMDYEKYRESVRTEIITGEVRRSAVGRRIYISPQEVNNLLEVMKEQTSDTVEYHLGHILVDFPAEPSQEDLTAAKERADKIIDLLNNDGDFGQIAIASSGDANALSGGDIGWKSINEMPTLFSDLVDGKAKGTIIGPIRTGLGFSIVKVMDIRGKETVEVEEVEARHILIEPSIILSEAKAESILQGLLDQLIAGEADFAELAKEHSDGPTSVRGGDLGWADPKIYDPAFRDVLASLEMNEYSKPFRSSFGWHITQLTGRRTLDATQQMNERKAQQILYKRKFGMESARWIKELRDDAFVEDLSEETN